MLCADQAEAIEYGSVVTRRRIELEENVPHVELHIPAFFNPWFGVVAEEAVYAPEAFEYRRRAG